DGEDLIADAGERDRALAGRELLEPLDGGGVRLPADRLHLSPSPVRLEGLTRGAGGCRGHGVELGEEPLHRAALAGFVGERLTYDPAGQVDGELSDVGPELPYDRLPFGRELFAPRRDDPVGLLPGAGEHVLPDALGVGRCLLPDPGRLGTGLGELQLVLLEERVRLGLALLK